MLTVSFLFFSIYSNLPFILLNIVSIIVLQFTSDNSNNRSLFLFFAVWVVGSSCQWKFSSLVCLFIFGYMVNTALDKLFLGITWILQWSIFLQRWFAFDIARHMVLDLSQGKLTKFKTWSSLKTQRIDTCLYVHGGWSTSDLLWGYGPSGSHIVVQTVTY